MIWYIICAAAGLILGAVILYFVLSPKVKITAQRNTEIENENVIITNKNKELKEENEQLESWKETLTDQNREVSKSIEILQAKQTEIKVSLDNLKETQTKAVEEVYKSVLEVAQTNFDRDIEQMSEQLEKDKEELTQSYLDMLAESAQHYTEEMGKKQDELDELSIRLAEIQTTVNTAVDALKRSKEMEEQADFYRLILSKEDIMEIKRLREVLPYLRDKEPLNKVIYQVYYSKPYADLVGRVVGPGRHTGIYRITNLENKMCYVGQSVDIAERWRQHIKRGVGAEPPTRNKLYPAMLAYGVENFVFEVLEECPREKLDEREDYWQNFFHAKDYGYSLK